MLTPADDLPDGEDQLTPSDKLALVSPDLTIELIHEVVLHAYDPYVTSLGGFEPKNGKGTTLQIHATDYLRGRLCSIGWKKTDLYQVPCVVNREHGVRLCCSTDGGSSVGKKLNTPVLRKKGIGTRRIVGYHACDTLPIPGLEHLSSQEDATGIDDLDFYYLLIHVDERKREIRLEVSKPVFDEHGDVTQWADRIILPPLSLSPELPVTEQEVPKPEIQVKKRKSS